MGREVIPARPLAGSRRDVHENWPRDALGGSRRHARSTPLPCTAMSTERLGLLARSTRYGIGVGFAKHASVLVVPVETGAGSESEALMSLATRRGVNLDAISRGCPEWTSDEVGLALGGLDRHKAWAVLYSWCGDDSVRAGSSGFDGGTTQGARGTAVGCKGGAGYRKRTKFSEELTDCFYPRNGVLA